MPPRPHPLLLWPLVAAFLFAGVMHIARPGVFLPIVPHWVPLPRLTVVATGWCEVAGAIGLCIPRLRRLSAVMLALYAVCVFPANVKHALDYAQAAGFGRGWLYHAPRLLFQPVIVWWCLFVGGITRWPFTARSRAVPALPLHPPRSPGPRG